MPLKQQQDNGNEAKENVFAVYLPSMGGINGHSPY